MAEPGFDAHGPVLAPHDSDLRDPLYVHRPGAMRAGDFFGAVVFEYAEAPLVQAVVSENTQTESAVVDDLVAAQVSVGGAFHDRLRVHLLAPVYLTSKGLQGREGPTLGDMRLSGQVNLVAPERVSSGAGGLGLGIIGNLDLPTGDAERFLGRGAMSGGGRLAATWEFPSLTLGAEGGIEGAPDLSVVNLRGGTLGVAGVSAGVLVRDKTAFTVEGIFRGPFAGAGVPGTGLHSEVVLSVRGRGERGAGWTVGGAAGLTEGAGVPAFRAFLGFGFGRQEPPELPDADTEGVLRVDDACPLEPETVNGYLDDDGCPDALAALSVDVRFDGASWPADVVLTGPSGESTGRVGPDVEMTATATPGTTWSATATADCLSGAGQVRASGQGTALVVELRANLDTPVEIVALTPQGDPVDGVAVWRSATPHCVPSGPFAVTQGSLVQDVGVGTHTVSLAADGFAAKETTVEVVAGQPVQAILLLEPNRVRVEAERIVISEKVHFEEGNAVIAPKSFGLLDEVATTLLAHPEAARVEIAGHTDSQGSDAYNQRLSQRRAEGVRGYLIAKGVRPERLVAVGYGESRPITTNRTPGGRERNRRVEFNILEETP